VEGLTLLRVVGIMGSMDNTQKAPSPKSVGSAVGTGSVGAPNEVSPFGPNAAQILATEHWSLLGTRALIWNEALSRATVFLTVLSASIISIALLADATGFGPQTTVLALVLLPVVFLLGLFAYARLVQINVEEFQLVLAMNRLRQAYIKLEPGLESYFTTGFHDDERGIVTSYMLDRPSRLWLWIHFIVNTPTIIGTVDAAIAAAVIVLLLQLASAPVFVVMAGGAAVFLAIWVALYALQLRSLHRLLDQPPRFPTPTD
jgi:hypothetical protein